MSAVHHDVADVDPLYDPTWAIFIYAAWAGLAWVAGETVGLVALLGCTAALGALPVSRQRQATPRTFAAEFSSILLFCAATIAGAVLVLRAIDLAPELQLSGLFFAASAAILVSLWRSE